MPSTTKPKVPRAKIRKIEDPLVPKRGAVARNNPAFNPPRRAPDPLESLMAPARGRLVQKLIPDPFPPIDDHTVRNLKALTLPVKRFHGVKVPLYWFPGGLLRSPCADKFGYMFPLSVRKGSKLPFDATHQSLLDQLGGLMGDVARDTGADSTIPAGYTYFGQFVDHDITLDTSSTIDAEQNAETITNMRSPSLDLDAVYGRGPALDPYLYSFPGPALPSTAVKMQLGRNQNQGTGGPPNLADVPATPTNFDVPRVMNIQNGAAAADSTFTAIIGDPRNDENLIVSQFHHAMLKFHNRVVDLLVSTNFAGDIFSEAKRVVTRHYQWTVLHDFLPRICGAPAVNAAVAGVNAAVGSAFRMPVEFSVAAYRFGHSMIRNGYVLNTSLPPAVSTLKGVFDFIRVPLLPVFSNWAVDFNMYFSTAHPAPAGTFNNARKIDSVLAAGLETLPGGSGLMAVLAARNLRRGLAMGLPSGQAAAAHFGVPALTQAEIEQGLPANEVALLRANNNTLLTKTPLWYYVLREAAIKHGGNQLGAVGGRIVAETFVRILKRDAESILNVPGFAPTLPSSIPGSFTIADMLEFAGVLRQ
jgi:hypothetical protein